MNLEDVIDELQRMADYEDVPLDADVIIMYPGGDFVVHSIESDIDEDGERIAVINVSRRK